MIKKKKSIIRYIYGTQRGGKYSKENLFMEKRDVKYPVT